MSVKATKHETADDRESTEANEACHDAAIETNGTALVAATLDDAAKAKGMNMAVDKAGLSRFRCPIHPGKLLREYVVPATKKTETEIAKDLGISPQHLQDILFERMPVISVVAASLGRQFGNGPGLWLRMQAKYDEWRASRSDSASESE